MKLSPTAKAALFAGGLVWSAFSVIYTAVLIARVRDLEVRVMGLEFSPLPNDGYCESVIVCDSAADAFDRWLDLRRGKAWRERAGEMP